MTDSIVEEEMTLPKKNKLPPVHPGEVLLEEFLLPMSLTASRLATELHVPATRISEITHGRRSITAETALRLARYFGTTAEFWIRLQGRYDLQIAEDENAEIVEREVRPMARV
ncbi:MAG TPA: HigA family addiction module antitoxin [Candidatus Tumulicola sp.]|nr:HigA family addiction module antitoxin [Candidatus Tumulicola sp.]